MFRITKKVFSILNNRQRKMVFLLGMMMLAGGMMESLSVSLIMPLISAVINEDTWLDPWYAKIICSIFNIDSHRGYI